MIILSLLCLIPFWIHQKGQYYLILLILLLMKMHITNLDQSPLNNDVITKSKIEFSCNDGHIINPN